MYSCVVGEVGQHQRSLVRNAAVVRVDPIHVVPVGNAVGVGDGVLDGAAEDGDTGGPCLSQSIGVAVGIGSGIGVGVGVRAEVGVGVGARITSGPGSLGFRFVAGLLVGSSGYHFSEAAELGGQLSKGSLGRAAFVLRKVVSSSFSS